MSEREAIHPRTEYEQRKSARYASDIDVKSRGTLSFQLGTQKMWETKFGKMGSMENYGGAFPADADPEYRKSFLLFELAHAITDVTGGVVDKLEGTLRDRGSAPDGLEERNKKFERVGNALVDYIDLLDVSIRVGKIQSFSIEKGILTLHVFEPPKKDTTTYVFNLSKVFREKQDGTLEISGRNFEAELKKGGIKRSLDELREATNTEIILDGAIKVVYAAPATAVAGLAGAAIADTGIGMRRRTLNAQRRIVNMFVYDVATKEYIPVKPQVLQRFGNKLTSTTIFKFMAETMGYVYNVTRKAFTSVALAAADRAAATMLRMRYDPKKFPDIRSPEAFEAKKLELTAKIDTALKSGADFSGKLFGGTMKGLVHYGFWGVFFSEYQKNYNDAVSIHKGVAEALTFGAGAAVGAQLPGMWKAPGALVGGGLALMGAHALTPSDIDKKLWKQYPNRMSGDGSKSATAHVLTGGATADMLDKGNTDFGIPGTRGGARLVIPWPGVTDQVMPEVPFTRTNVNFGVSPKVYLSGRIAPTDHWNARMDQFVGTDTEKGYLVPEIMKLLRDYQKGLGLFREGNVNNWIEKLKKQKKIDSQVTPEAAKVMAKDEALRDRIKPLIGLSDETDPRASGIIEDCISYVVDTVAGVKDPKEQERMLEMFFQNYGNVLKIDESSIAHDKELLKADQKHVLDLILKYGETVGGDKGAFAMVTFDRLLKGQDLVTWVEQKKVEWTVPKNAPNPQFWSRTETGMPAPAFPDTYEESQFRALVDDPTPLTDEQAQTMGIDLTQNRKEKKPKTRGDYFCFLLGMLTEVRTQKRYLETASTVGYANTWRAF